MTRCIHIDRLELDLRGIDPATAQAALQLLGPALQAELAGTLPGHRLHASTQHIDAGRVAPHPQPQGLAERLAQRVARRVVPTGTKD